MTMRTLVAIGAATLFSTGCTVVNVAGKYAVQHTLGVKAGPCPASMDSVKVQRGKAWATYRSDEEDTSDGAQRFWHEWAYTMPNERDTERPDSVAVVGFLWGAGVNGCQVSERRVRASARSAIPWEGAGMVPRGE